MKDKDNNCVVGSRMFLLAGLVFHDPISISCSASHMGQSLEHSTFTYLLRQYGTRQGSISSRVSRVVAVKAVRSGGT